MTDQTTATIDSASQQAADASAADTTQATAGATDAGNQAPADSSTASTTEAAKPQGAPEAYEFKLPDNAAMDLTAFGAFAKSQNLTQEAAQSMLDNLAPAMAQAQAEQHTALTTQWVADVKADKELGGEKAAENLAIAQKALKQFGTPELGKFLDETGLGNHPEIIRAFFKAGQAISEDTGLTGTKSVTGPTTVGDRAKVLYPNSKHV
jgi:hypothetical protein